MPSDVQAPRQRRSSPSAAKALENAQKATKGAKVGRPLTYSPELCEHAIALGMRGKHQAAIAREFNVDHATLSKWAADYPEFSVALARAKTYSQAWWEDDVQRNRKAKHYQGQPVRLIMSGQFKHDYAETRGGDTLAQGLMDWLNAITNLAQDKTAPKAIDAQVVDMKDKKLE